MWSIDQPSTDLNALADEVIRSRVDVVLATGPEASLQAAVAAGPTTPIVILAINYDPIERGYVKTLSRPGSNVTGVVMRQTELAEKQVELLTHALPGKTRLAVLWDAFSADQFEAAIRRAKALGLQAQSFKLENPPYDFDGAYRTMAASQPEMLLVLSSQYFGPHARRIAGKSRARDAFDRAGQHREPVQDRSAESRSDAGAIDPVDRIEVTRQQRERETAAM